MGEHRIRHALVEVAQEADHRLRRQLLAVAREFVDVDEQDRDRLPADRAQRLVAPGQRLDQVGREVALEIEPGAGRGNLLQDQPPRPGDRDREQRRNQQHHEGELQLDVQVDEVGLQEQRHQLVHAGRRLPGRIGRGDDPGLVAEQPDPDPPGRDRAQPRPEHQSRAIAERRPGQQHEHEHDVGVAQHQRRRRLDAEQGVGGEQDEGQQDAVQGGEGEAQPGIVAAAEQPELEHAQEAQRRQPEMEEQRPALVDRRQQPELDRGQRQEPAADREGQPALLLLGQRRRDPAWRLVAPAHARPVAASSRRSAAILRRARG